MVFSCHLSLLIGISFFIAAEIDAVADCRFRIWFAAQNLLSVLKLTRWQIADSAYGSKRTQNCCSSAVKSVPITSFQPVSKRVLAPGNASQEYRHVRRLHSCDASSLCSNMHTSIWFITFSSNRTRRISMTTAWRSSWCPGPKWLSSVAFRWLEKLPRQR